MCVSSDAAALVLDAYDGLACGGVGRNDFVESADREHFADRIRERADCESGIAPLQIPSEVLEKIPNPFFTTKPTDQGTGLGLALSNDIVREHGGEIRVDTRPGDFTEVILNLPKNAKVEENGDVTSADGSDAV